MNLAKFPRRRYTSKHTDIEYLDRLTRLLKGPNIYIKRDDMLGLAGGGNKTRKLEFVVADALSKNADTLITCGAVQSNHCRITAGAAAKEGLKCYLVLEERVPGSYNSESCGNNLLFHMLGVENYKIVSGGSDMLIEMSEVADELYKNGGKPYIIPGGASTPIGALGYIACAEEILSQMFDMGIVFDRVVCASGSAGTHAGLLAGMFGNHAEIDVIGINVSRKKDEQETIVYELAKDTLALLNIVETLPRKSVTCFDESVGPGYSLPTDEMFEAVSLLAKTEGILLDPVYTGKAMAGLLRLVRSEYFAKNENILFIHTGGSPALHAYSEPFWDYYRTLSNNNQ